MLFVGTGAAVVGGDAGAADRGEGAVDVAHEIADQNLIGWFGEGIAAILPAGAHQVTGLAEVDEDLLEKRGGNVLGFRQGRERHQGAVERLGHAQIEHGAQGVFSAA